MAINTLLYFAYGSNMLAERLTDRCPSAVALGKATAKGYELLFTKKGLDGSGKATLVPSDNEKAFTKGVVFVLAKNDLAALDKVERNYTRVDDFEIEYEEKKVFVTTYIADQKYCEIGLLALDWYRDICVAGAKQHGIDVQYIRQMKNLKVQKDPQNPAHSYILTKN